MTKASSLPQYSSVPTVLPSKNEHQAVNSGKEAYPTWLGALPRTVQIDHDVNDVHPFIQDVLHTVFQVLPSHPV